MLFEEREKVIIKMILRGNGWLAWGKPRKLYDKSREILLFY